MNNNLQTMLELIESIPTSKMITSTLFEEKEGHIPTNSIYYGPDCASR